MVPRYLHRAVSKPRSDSSREFDSRLLNWMCLWHHRWGPPRTHCKHPPWRRKDLNREGTRGKTCTKNDSVLHGEPGHGYRIRIEDLQKGAGSLVGHHRATFPADRRLWSYIQESLKLTLCQPVLHAESTNPFGR